MNFKKFTASVLCLILFTQTAFATGGLTFEESISRPGIYSSNGYFCNKISLHDYLVCSGTTAAAVPVGKVTFFKEDNNGNFILTNSVINNSISAVPAVSSNSSFGMSVATHSNLAIVGAHTNPTNAGLSNGSAYIFEYDNNLNEFVYLETLEQDSQSTNPSSLGNNSGNDRFGISVDIFDDGNIKYAAVVNSFNKEALIYENTGNGWIAVFNTGNIGNSMTWPNIVINSEYMALSQNTNVNGSNINQQNNVLIYKKTNGTWNLHQTINAEASSSNSYFSNDIALNSDNKLAVAAYNHNDFGAVFIYEINPVNGEFELEETLIDQLSGSSSFGYAVDIDQNNLLIGNSGDKIVYKYYKDQTWQLDDTITHADVLSNGVTDSFGLGQSLALRDNIFFVNTMRDFLSLHRYSFINLSNDGEPIPEFKDYVLFAVILISGFAIFRRLPSIIKTK